MYIYKMNKRVYFGIRIVPAKRKQELCLPRIEQQIPAQLAHFVGLELGTPITIIVPLNNLRLETALFRK